MGGVVGRASRRYDVSHEEQILEWWNACQVYRELKAMRRNGEKFYFLDGPPYVTNPPHIGTAWNKILKDVLIRYKRMRGYDVRDQPGYDCHGLPIEVKVEEELKIGSKKEIEEKIGVSSFISTCKRYAFENAEKQTEVFKNLGVWMDWENPYMTLHRNYMESVWWTVKRAYEKGLLDRGLKVVHWCPRCETALAGYEVTDEYRMVKDYSVYVKFPLKEKDGNTSILIWTTTPWTLPANVAVMVNPDEYYVEVEFKGERYILAEARCPSVFEAPWVVKRRFKGAELEGLRYTSPLRDYVALQRDPANPHVIVSSREYVSMQEGTGCVHTAPGHGEEDFEVGLERGLPVYSPIDARGCFTEEAGKYAGMYVKDADSVILEDLKRANALFKVAEVTHSYPHCWRCKTPLLMRATEQWFIKISLLKDRMMEENLKVYWSPQWAGSKRFADWLKGARDWVISRQRFWGVPLPVWVCDSCRKQRVVGSVEELRSLVNPPPVLEDLHRDTVDPIKLKCECGGVMSRVPDIVDVWLDSGVAAWASLNYPVETEEYEKWWPADAIIEAHDQTRGWFYTQLGAGVLCFEKSPYQAVLMHGHALDSKGQKMSKSLGNFIDPLEAVAKHGRDSLRVYELQSTTWEDFKFSWEKLEDTSSKLKVVWNVISFASLYMSLDRFNPSNYPLKKVVEQMRAEDKWLVSRVERLKTEVTEAMEKLEFHNATRKLMEFAVEDLSHWYVRLVRRRFWQERESLDKLAAYAALYHALKSWILLSAPIAPFLTEKAYREMILPAEPGLPKSVHMNDWPEADPSLIDETLERRVHIVRAVSAASMSARQMLKIKLRQPVGRLLIFTDDPEVRDAVENLRNLTLQVTNSKNVEVLDLASEKTVERLYVKPDYKVMGPRLREEAFKVAEALKQVDGFKLRDALASRGRWELTVQGKVYDITPDMVSFEEKMPEGFAGASFPGGRVYVDSRLSEELLKEGFVQDVVRRIQEMRRQLDLEVDAYVDVHIASEDRKALEWVQSSHSYISEEVRARTLTASSTPPPENFYMKDWMIGGQSLRVGVKKV